MPRLFTEPDNQRDQLFGVLVAGLVLAKTFSLMARLRIGHFGDEQRRIHTEKWPADGISRC